MMSIVFSACLTCRAAVNLGPIAFSLSSTFPSLWLIDVNFPALKQKGKHYKHPAGLVSSHKELLLPVLSTIAMRAGSEWDYPICQSHQPTSDTSALASMPGYAVVLSTAFSES